MKIIDIKVYKGRNLYSHKPIIKFIVDIGKYNDIPTKDIHGFNEKLLAMFPGLSKHTCGLGYEGGFLERLEEGTYLAHVLEHVILDIQNTLGFDVKHGKTRLQQDPSTYYIVCEYENEICALEIGKIALYLLNQIINEEETAFPVFLDFLHQIKLETELGPSTAAIVKEAKKRYIPVTRIGYESLVRLGYGKYSRIIEATLTDATSCISADISCNKNLTKSILYEHNIPVPHGKIAFSKESALIAANAIGYPVVIKPCNGNQGKGVQLDLQDEEDIKKSFAVASKFSSGVIVESYIKGNDYRILVIGGQVKAVSHRLPATITGDGVHTIQELVDIINQDPKRGENHEKPLTKIKLDTITSTILKRKSLTFDSVLKKDETISLRENGNISTGGIAIDCTDIIHPDNAELAIKAAEAIGIDIAGIDMITEDISKSILTSDGAIIEVNSAPGIRMHLYPSQGTPRNVAKDIIELLFPQNQDTNLPIISVTGTNGKTTTARLLNHVLTNAGKTVGMTSTSGTFIGEKCINKGDNSGPNSAKLLLTNKTIDVAILETARGGILREGLGYDLADIGILTNISEDHLGLDGIDTLEQMSDVKSIVVEAVKPGGFAILNAEDKMTNRIIKHVEADIILFYKNKDALQYTNLDEHILVYVEDSYIKIKDRKKIMSVVKVDEIPITYQGLVECNIDNCLAVVSALYGLNTPINEIVKGLVSFQNNPGRFQMFHMNNYRIMLDYAHNTSGYTQIMKLCKSFDDKRSIGIIGMPGDRPDKAIKEVASLAASVFDVIYIKEDTDLRNREKGEIVKLFYDSLLECSFDKENINIIYNEVEALKDAMSHTQKDDLIVMLYEQLDPLLEVIKNDVNFKC
jgi:cyanophycin synthetase